MILYVWLYIYDIMSTRQQILNYYIKDKYGKDVYSSNNPCSIYEILAKVVNDYHPKYMNSIFCKKKHEELQARYYGYSFHCLNSIEMEEFINEISNMKNMKNGEK